MHKLLYMYYNSRALPDIPRVAHEEQPSRALLGSSTALLDGLDGIAGEEEEAVDVGAAADMFIEDLDVDQLAVSREASNDESALPTTQRSTT